jgi:hypothetical protein
MMLRDAARLGLIVALAAQVGCGGGEGGGGSIDAMRGRLEPGSRAVIYDDEVKTLFIGKSMLEVTVGATVRVVKDEGDPGDDRRPVTIDVPADAVVSAKKATGKDASETIMRRNLRPVE